MAPKRFALSSAAVVAAVSLILASGCGEEGETSKSSDSTTTPAAPEQQTTKESESGATDSPIAISVTADKIHAVQPNDEINIDVTVEGFALDGAKLGAAAEPGSGHYHVYIGSADGEPLLVSAKASDVVKVPADVTDGTHTMRIQLRNHDHSSLDPPVEATVRLIIYRL